MNTIDNIRDIVKIKELESEYDLQKASLLDRKLRLLIEDDDSLIPIRKKLRDLIYDYEKKHWRDSENITDKQIKESDKAVELVYNEQLFFQQRKEIIRSRLKEYDMNQQELGALLGHSKTYISELVNGASNFSIKDLVVIHRIFKISFDILIPTFLQNETKDQIKRSIKKLNKPKLKLSKEDLFV